MPDVTLTRTEYEYLLDNSRQYEEMITNSTSPNTDLVQRDVDLRNGITRYVLNVRWQNIGGQPPTRIEIGRGWPATQTAVLTLERPITKEDVQAFVAARASNPVDIAVTKDRRGVVGWTLIDDWDFINNV